MTETMTMNMGMSKSGAETAEELKLSSLKHALHPSVLEEAMPRIAGPERLAEHSLHADIYPCLVAVAWLSLFQRFQKRNGVRGSPFAGHSTIPAASSMISS